MSEEGEDREEEERGRVMPENHSETLHTDLLFGAFMMFLVWIIINVVLLLRLVPLGSLQDIFIVTIFTWVPLVGTLLFILLSLAAMARLFD